MGTRSRIAVMHGEVYKSVYCHWDGYLEHNGKILQEYYDSSKANNLVALGDVSSLGPKIGDAHPFSKFEIDNESPDFAKLMATHEQAQAEGWTTFYGRDRGVEDTEFKSDLTFADFLARVDGCCAEYYYVMRDGVWYTGCPDKGSKLVPLAEALATIDEMA